VLLLVTLPPHQPILKPILSHAATSRLSINTITDRNSVLEAQRYSNVVLPCHVASFALGPSHTTILSTVRLLALTYAAHACRPAQQRTEIISAIHEELGDL